jgi:hypothetical protein
MMKIEKPLARKVFCLLKGKATVLVSKSMKCKGKTHLSISCFNSSFSTYIEESLSTAFSTCILSLLKGISLPAMGLILKSSSVSLASAGGFLPSGSSLYNSRFAWHWFAEFDAVH